MEKNRSVWYELFQFIIARKGIIKHSSANVSNYKRDDK